MSESEPRPGELRNGDEQRTGGESAAPGAAQRGYPGPMAYAGIGMLNAVCILGGGALGWLLDRSVGTLPLFLLIGLLAGAAAGVLGTRGELRRYNR